MGLVLNLGVLDVGYSDANGSGQTTGYVAGVLEKNYGIMGTFLEINKEKIAGYLADAMADSIQVLVNTGGRINTGGRMSSASHILAGTQRTVSGRQSGSLTFAADQKIETLFREFIFSGQMGRINFALTGKPLSAAAAAGVNHRKMHPYAKANKARPDFVDTGLFVSSFRVWTTASVGVEGY